jgi:DNA-directed RNA polymerase specialized sigma24 family protein
VPDDIDASTVVEAWRSLPERDPRVQLEIQQLGAMVQNALAEFATQGIAQQRQAQLLRRRVLDEVSYSELGAELQCTESALRVRVHKATQAFRKHLRECHPEILPERASDASASA